RSPKREGSISCFNGLVAIAVKVIEYEGLGRIGRRVSRLVLLRYLELCVAVGVEGDSDEIRPAAYCTVLGVDLPRAATGIHEGVVLLTAERARVDHAFFGDQRYALAQAPPISIARSLSLRRPVGRNGSTACS